MAARCASPRARPSPAPALGPERLASPSRFVDVGEIERVDELSVRAVATMADQVDLREPRTGGLPSVDLQGDVMLEKGSRLGAAVQTPVHLTLVRLKPPVDLPRADRQRLAGGFLRDVHSLAGPGQPSGEQRLQTNRARVSGGLPDGR